MKFFKGNFFHTPTYGKLEYLENVLIEIDENGVISKIYNTDNPDYNNKYLFAKNNNLLYETSKNQYFLPGFIDLHVHAPQWPQAGIALDEPLNIWLDECTFPLEAKYKDLDFAKTVYTDLVKNLIKRGTTTVLYFATIHKESSIELAKICKKLGQRGLIGKVVMDDKTMNPDFYRDESTESAIKDTEDFILEIKKLNEDCLQGVYPVVTPRFVPSCTDKALEELGKLAKKYDTHIQSHCSEGEWEHNFVKERFGIRDTQVLEKFGLLTDKSVMAHCNFINEEDGEIFKKHSSSVGHCPISNVYFANGVIPIKKLKNQGVNIGLGTDISGGFSPSLYENIRQAVMYSRMLEDGVDVNLPKEKRGVNNSRISIIEAFYLATTGGGEALKLPIGIIKEGYAFDVQCIDISSLPNFNVFEKPDEILQRILYLSTTENINSVFIQGKNVYKK